MKQEILNNFEAFDKQWPDDMRGAFDTLSSETVQFELSYIRICCVQAWREMFIDAGLSGAVMSFLTEAQNDLLMSHCLARVGGFRSSLKSLRACIENFYFFGYYAEHPVEMARWKLGEHRMSFSDLHSYFEVHPDLKPFPIAATSLATLKKEYATLSKAIHGSDVAFQMTAQSDSINLWSADPAGVGKWKSREASVIAAVVSILATLHRAKLQGTSRLGLRQLMKLALPLSVQARIKNQLNINLPAVS